jgi:hypothetical protein
MPPFHSTCTPSKIDLQQYDLNRRNTEEFMIDYKRNCKSAFMKFRLSKNNHQYICICSIHSVGITYKGFTVMQSFVFLVQDHKLMPRYDMEKTVTSEAPLDWSVSGCCLA